MTRAQRTLVRLAGTIAVLAGVATSTVSSAGGTHRLWVELPRAIAPEDGSDFPFPPEPTPAALVRRAARGRPERIAVLERGPSVESLRAVEATGARIHRISRWLSAVSVEADTNARRRLVSRFGRDAVRPVAAWSRRPVQVRADAPLERWTPVGGYGLSRIQNMQSGLDRLHARGLSGEGVRVLVLDTGCRLEHPALADLQVEATWDFVNDDADVGLDPGEVDQQDRHGTGVVGVMAGFVAGELVGASPRARFLIAKTEFIETETRTEEDDYVAALEWGEALGADVMNASLSYRVFTDEPDTFAYDFEDLDGDTAITTRAVDDLVALGVVAVVSAGNDGSDGPGSINTPADADSCLAVAAVDSNGVVTAFSSRGPTADGRHKPDLAALGQRVRWAHTGAETGTAWAAGTSVAAPLVASAVALALEAHPTWGPGDVIDAFRGTASQANEPDDELGWGIMDAHAAVFDVEAPQTPLPFALRTPEDQSVVQADPTVAFAWEPAEDLQTPGVLTYRIEWSADAFAGPLEAVFETGPATARELVPPRAGPLWWRVVATDPDGHERASATRRVDVDSATVAIGPSVRPWARLATPWPNPGSGAVTAVLGLDRPARLLRVEVYDVAGRRVRTLRRDQELLAGEWRITWDGRDRTGRRTGSGVYFLRGVVRGRTGESLDVQTRFTRLR